MSVKGVENRKIIGGHIGNGACDLSLAVKTARGITVGSIIHGAFVNVIVIHNLTPVAADNDQAVGAYLLVRIFRSKFRVHNRILCFHFDMIGCFFVFLKKFGNHLVLGTALGNLINRYVLIQFLQKILRLIPDAEKLLVADVKLRICGGECVDNEIYHYNDHYENHTENHTVGTVFQGLFVNTLFYIFLFILIFIFFLKYPC